MLQKRQAPCSHRMVPFSGDQKLTSYLAKQTQQEWPEDFIPGLVLKHHTSFLSLWIRRIKCIKSFLERNDKALEIFHLKHVMILNGTEKLTEASHYRFWWQLLQSNWETVEHMPVTEGVKHPGGQARLGPRSKPPPRDDLTALSTPKLSLNASRILRMHTVMFGIQQGFSEVPTPVLAFLGQARSQGSRRPTRRDQPLPQAEEEVF